MEQQLLDRAREWLNENSPNLDDEAFEAKLAEVAAELADIDLAADIAERF
jgi:hypothetical protein